MQLKAPIVLKRKQSKFIPLIAIICFLFLITSSILVLFDIKEMKKFKRELSKEKKHLFKIGSNAYHELLHKK